MAIRQTKPSSQTSLLDLGPSLPVTATREAEDALARLPQKAMQKLRASLRAWTSDVPVSEARASLYIDPEDKTWSYVLLEILAEVGNADFEHLADALLQLDQASVDGLAAKDRERILAGYQVTLLRPEEWDDEPAFCS